jgi:hypothetical protein
LEDIEHFQDPNLLLPDNLKPEDLMEEYMASLREAGADIFDVPPFMGGHVNGLVNGPVHGHVNGLAGHLYSQSLAGSIYGSQSQGTLDGLSTQGTSQLDPTMTTAYGHSSFGTSSSSNSEGYTNFLNPASLSAVDTRLEGLTVDNSNSTIETRTPQLPEKKFDINEWLRDDIDNVEEERDELFTNEENSFA